MIGGNTTAVIQTAQYTENAIGEHVPTVYTDAQSVSGFLDLMGGGAGYSAYHAKIQESTHVFICDYVPLADGIKAENARMVIDGAIYDITMTDDPMGLHEQLEFYLKYTGGHQGGNG